MLLAMISHTLGTCPTVTSLGFLRLLRVKWNESAPNLRFPSMWVLIILPWGVMKPRWHLDAEARRAQLNAR